jgi:hypothetical protein
MKFVRLFILSLLLVGTVSHAQTIKENYAFAVIGEPKYAINFSHFDYVNPLRLKAAILRFRISVRSIASTALHCAVTPPCAPSRSMTACLPPLMMNRAATIR